MSDRPRLFNSSSGFNVPRHRSHSYRERTTRPANDLYDQKMDRIQRRFEEELDNSGLELQWALKQRRESFSSPTEYLENVRTKIRRGYNQLMRQKVEEVEDYLNERNEEERRLAQRKLRKAQAVNEKFRVQSINQMVRERDAICEEKLAAQRSLYNRLLEEQTQRYNAEKNLKTFENLNVDQLKDRLTRVEHSNDELKQLIRHLIDRQPSHKSAVFIPHFNA